MRLREAYSLVDRCMANVSLDPGMAKRFRWDIEHLTTFYPHGLTSNQLRDKVAAMAEELLGLLDDAEGGGVRRRPRGGLLLHLGLLTDDLTKLEPIRRAEASGPVLALMFR